MILKRNAFYLFLLVVFFGCDNGNAQKKTNTFYNKQFNWRISVPANFVQMKDKDYKAIQQKGTEAIEDGLGGEKINNQSKPILVFRNDEMHYFEANYQPFDEKVDGDFFATSREVDSILYNTFVAKMPNAKIDTFYTSEVIDKLKFRVFNLNAAITDKVTLHTKMFNHLFGKKEFNVSIMYVNDQKGKVMLDAFRHSTFSK